MATLFSDNFNRANGAPGGNWHAPATNTASNLTIVSNALSFDNTTTGFYQNSTALGTADVEVSADIVDSAAMFAGVVARAAADGSAGYFCRIAGANIGLFRRVAGSTTQLGSDTNFGGVATTTYTVKLSCVGSLIRAFVNGVERVRATDANVTAAGESGVYATTGGTTTWDNFSVTDVPLILLNDPNCIVSSWYAPGGGASAKTIDLGATIRVGFTGTSCVVKLSGGAPAMTIRYSVDNAPWASVTQTTDLNVTATALAAGNHTLLLQVYDCQSGFDRWATPTMFVLVSGFAVDAAATSTAPKSPRKTKWLYVYGDSITSGNAGAATEGCFGTWPQDLGEALGAETVQVGVSTQGWLTAAGQSWGIPTFHTIGSAANQTWNRYFNGQSRLVGGLLSPAPDYVVINHATNDAIGSPTDANLTAAVNDFLVQLRLAAPNAQIFLLVPFGGFRRTALSAVTLPDAKCYFIDLDPTGTDLNIGLQNLGASRRSADGLHPTAGAHGELAARTAAAIQAKLGSGSGARGRIVRIG